MRGTTLEGHFWTAAPTEANRTAPSAGLSVPRLGPLAADLRDLGSRRLADMDAAGVDVPGLSVGPPGAQGLTPATAVQLSRQANDRLAEAVGEHPDRFAGFATLPTPDPEAAAA